MEQTLEVRKDGLTNALTSVAKDNFVMEIEDMEMSDNTDNVRIRKLTPKECFRLQGWKDEDFEKAEMVNSNSQLYKQAGNGVTVDVIKAIGERLKD